MQWRSLDFARDDSPGKPPVPFLIPNTFSLKPAALPSFSRRYHHFSFLTKIQKPAGDQISLAGFLAQDMHFAIYKEVGPPRRGRLSGDLPRRPADSLDQFRRAYPKECPLPDGVSYYAARKENGQTFREEIICYIRT